MNPLDLGVFGLNKRSGDGLLILCKRLNSVSLSSQRIVNEESVLGTPAQENIVLSNLDATAKFVSSQLRLRDCAENALLGYQFNWRQLPARAGFRAATSKSF